MLLKDRGSNDRVDLEAHEMCIRASMHTMGSKVLETLLNADGGGYTGKSLPCNNGHTYEFTEYRKKEALTVLGVVQVNRAYYYDRQCGSGICPKDKALDIEGTSFSPGVRRIWIWNIADECFPVAVLLAAFKKSQIWRRWLSANID